MCGAESHITSTLLNEPAEENPVLDQLSVGEGLLEINHTW